MQGLIALAVAMGIGRFAFTPVLPMMQSGSGLTVVQGGWLASANYTGYLLGALTAMAMRERPGRKVRIGLASVGIATLAMAGTYDFTAWMGLRFAAGVASAWVLVFASQWCLERGADGAVVFAGVGAGIALAGLVCLVLMDQGRGAEEAWVVLGLVAIAFTVLVWRYFADNSGAAAPAANGSGFRWDSQSIRLVIAYGAFGFGYIIPATFLPAMAKQALDDPSLFGWSWPIFGAAAATSTFAAGALRRHVTDRALWIGAHVLMALGIMALASPWIPVTGAMTICAILVGGTFMVATMAGIQEARRVCGAGGRKLIAAMTAAFAAGQIAGPVLVSAGAGIVASLWIAAVTLIASALMLWRTK